MQMKWEGGGPDTPSEQTQLICGGKWLSRSEYRLFSLQHFMDNLKSFKFTREDEQEKQAGTADLAAPSLSLQSTGHKQELEEQGIKMIR
ncbi:hypothetical protein INR49_009871 [Caranx melampygus]|nr:hypothetical protein INR49_009871 [Caranx melampygus]